MNRIKELREKRGLSIDQLSKELKAKGISISPASISKYEREERNPKIENWIKLADFFNVPVSYLQGIGEYNYANSEDQKRYSDSIDKKLGFNASENSKDYWITPRILTGKINDEATRKFEIICKYLVQSSGFSSSFDKKIQKNISNMSRAEALSFVHYVEIAIFAIANGGTQKQELEKMLSKIDGELLDQDRNSFPF